MISFPKPRGFWDYSLFALAMTAVMSVSFWMEASDGISWRDAVLAAVSAVLFVFAVILARRREKATWIKQPSWLVDLLASVGAFAFIFGAIYADAYLFHPKDINANRFRDEVVLAIVFTAGSTLWSLRRRLPSRRPVS